MDSASCGHYKIADQSNDCQRANTSGDAEGGCWRDLTGTCSAALNDLSRRRLSFPRRSARIPFTRCPMNLPQVRATPVLGVQRVREAAEYYRDVLGFDLDPVSGVFQPSADEQQGVYAIVRLSSAEIHLQIRRRATDAPHRPLFERDVFLEVSDVASLASQLEQRGARILLPLSDAAYGFREFTVEDLNGYRITFAERL